MIYTFYSYQIGVGRTLALVNIAELLYHAGLRVLLVDWDLETPGLERYFPSLDLQQVLDRPGLMDLVQQYKEYMAQEFEHENATFELEDPSKHFITVYNDPPTAGSLYLLTAGRRSPQHFSRYVRLLSTFNWQEFYEVWSGEAYFNWLRKQFETIVDVVLINSRAGFTEMSGVCTYHLADVIVMFCEPNQQIIQSTYSMTQKFTAAKVQQVRTENSLKILIVPSGVDEGNEKNLLVAVEQEFLNKFNEKNFAGDSGLIANGRYTWELRIPQVPYYTFSETVVVRQPPEKRHLGLYDSYLRLMRRLVQQAPINSRLYESIEQTLSSNLRDTNGEIWKLSDVEFSVGDYVQPCSKVYLRKTPGYVKSVSENIKLSFSPDYIFEVLDGPCKIDGLPWWCIGVPQLYWGTNNGHANKGHTKPGTVSNGNCYAKGWVASQSPSGVCILQKVNISEYDSRIMGKDGVHKRMEKHDVALR